MLHEAVPPKQIYWQLCLCVQMHGVIICRIWCQGYQQHLYSASPQGATQVHDTKQLPRPTSNNGNQCILLAQVDNFLSKQLKGTWRMGVKPFISRFPRYHITSEMITQVSTRQLKIPVYDKDIKIQVLSISPIDILRQKQARRYHLRIGQNHRTNFDIHKINTWA